MSDRLTHQHGHHSDSSGPGAEAWRARARWVFIGFAVIAAAYLIAEHRAHLGGALPFLILLACPLLHMFMHGGHGGHGDHGKHGGDDQDGDRERNRAGG